MGGKPTWLGLRPKTRWGLRPQTPFVAWRNVRFGSSTTLRGFFGPSARVQGLRPSRPQGLGWPGASGAGSCQAPSPIHPCGHRPTRLGLFGPVELARPVAFCATTWRGGKASRAFGGQRPYGRLLPSEVHSWTSDRLRRTVVATSRPFVAGPPAEDRALRPYPDSGLGPQPQARIGGLVGPEGASLWAD